MSDLDRLTATTATLAGRARHFARVGVTAEQASARCTAAMHSLFHGGQPSAGCPYCAVKALGLAKPLLDQFEAMLPDEALPLMRRLIDAPETVAKLNATSRAQAR